MFDFQALIDGMNAAAQVDRAGSQMTLGGLIERLESMDSDAEIESLSAPHSYRGYYCDLSFECGDVASVAKVLAVAKSCMGVVFEGYKGGDFMMGASTPIWIASYGDCGRRIMDIDGSTFVTAEDDS